MLKKGKIENVREVTDMEFEEVVKSESAVIVDLWAPWCMPCRAVEPVFEELSNEYRNKVSFLRLNVDDNPGVPGRFGVRGIPTFLLFKNGKLVDRVVGAVPKSILEEAIKRLIDQS